MKQRLGRHKVLYIVLVATVVVLFYPFTIFFRGTIVPLYVNTFYRGSVASAYRTTFDDFNDQLANLGFKTSEEPATCYNGVSDSGNAWFHNISETVPCMKQSETQPLTLTTRFAKQWAKVAPTIHSTLLADNWTDSGHSPKLVDLYTNVDQRHDYTKAFGKYTCEVTFEHANYSGQPSDTNNSKAYVRESCTRNVSFFGGYRD